MSDLLLLILPWDLTHRSLDTFSLDPVVAAQSFVYLARLYGHSGSLARVEVWCG